MLQDVVLLNDLNPLQGGVDMWLCDAQFSQGGDCSLALLKLDRVECVVSAIELSMGLFSNWNILVI